MRIEFWLRTPGNHTRVSIVDMSVVPRQGESVTLDDGTERAREVHSVDYIFDKTNTPSARVLLSD
jgi:hypothetical protein